MDMKVSLWWSLCATIVLLAKTSSHSVSPPTLNKACEKTVADIVFLIDESGSVGFKNFLKIKQFVIDVVASLKIGENNVRVGVVTFSSYTFIKFHLNKYFDKQRMINAINNIGYFGGNTNTHKALRILRYTAFTKRNGDRIGVPNIAIVVTDGISSNVRATIKEAVALQKSGVVIFSIGIGKYLQQYELIVMASKPKSEHKLSADSFVALQYIREDLTKKLCEDSCISKGCQHGGTCRRIAKGWGCICTRRFYGKYCQREKKCYCNGYGNLHYKTFDGQLIHFPGICKYTLAESTDKAPHYFAVQVKNKHRGNTLMLYTRLVDIKLKNVSIRLFPGNKILVNGERRALPIDNVLGFSARYACGWITVSTSWGLNVQFDGRHRIKVKVNKRFANKLTGICGDCNGKEDDFRTKQGKNVSRYRNKYYLIGNSYKVNDGSDKPTTKCDQPIGNIGCKPHERRHCNLIKHIIFRKCVGKLGIRKAKEYLKSCRTDVCVHRTNRNNFKAILCSSIESFAGECAKAGVNVDWRRVAQCPKNCPPRELYKFATSICQPSCANPNPKCTGFIEGCVCRKGFILNGNKCTHKSECGCFYRGSYMKVNEDIIDLKCERKTICKAGGKLVTENLASCQPNGICTIRNYKRVCVCKRGFNILNGKCTPKVIALPENKACEKTVADIVFLIDESGSVGFKNFLKIKQFVIDVVASLKIGKSNVRVGVVTFSSYTFIKFHLNRYFDKQRMINAINNIGYFGGNTNTHKALKILRYIAFTKRNGDRIDVPNIAIVVTDGISSNVRATRKEAVALQNSGVVIFSIGVGKYYRQSELIAMANKPTSEHKFTVDTFDALQSITQKITKKMCKEREYFCNGYGKYHYKTFDGQMIHFPGICKYTLAASSKEASNFFVVEVKNERSGNISYTRLVDIKLKGYTIRLMPGSEMLVNGEKRTLPIHNVWGFSARYACGWITVTTSWGLNVQFDGRHRVKVKINGNFFNKLKGICGDCNGKKDDFRTKQGQDVSRYPNKYYLIGNSYRVTDGRVKTKTRCDLPDRNIGCKPHERKQCNLIKHIIFRKCVGKLGIRKAKEYLKSCRTDVCVFRENRNNFKTILCSSIESFAGECAKAGVNVDWRGIAQCPKICPPRQVYKFATPICQPSCANPKPKCTGFIEGCVCKKGFILSGNKCVPKSECGCFYKGLYMEVNEHILHLKCERKTICKAGGKLVIENLASCQPNGICALRKYKRVCVCKTGFSILNGKCTQKEKKCYCNGYGNLHYRTFDGQMIHFMGICRYTLAASTKEAPNLFAVEVDNKHRGNTHVLYTRLVDIKLRGVTIRLMPGNKMLVNGEKRALPIDVGGISARYGCGWITVSTSWGLNVQFDGRHRIKVKVNNRFANKLTGICGDCNGKEDDFRTKQGKDVSRYRDKHYLIGNSYKVNDGSNKPTTKCDLPDVKTDCKPPATKLCNLIKHRIFRKCFGKLGMRKVKDYLITCRSDVCMYHKKKVHLKAAFCSSMESFAGECAKAGINVNWRRIANCPKKCPPRQVYKYATPICQPSCVNRKPKCTGFIEGCVCKKGFILSGNECIPISKCGCFYRGSYMEVNEDIINPKCDRKTICKAGGKLVTKNLAPCQPNGICALQKYKRICVCKTGYFIYNGKCTLKACDKKVVDIVFLLDESGRVGLKNFLKVKQFVIDVVASLKIGENNVRVGVVTFSSYTFIKFHLNKYNDKQRMINAIKKIRYFGGNTNTHKALKILRYIAFTKRNGDRIGVPNIAIVVTDGISSNARATIKEAVALQKSGVVIFSIGAGKYIRQSELIAMTNKPNSEHKLTVNTFDALQSITQKITKKICKVKMYECSGFGNFHYNTFDGQTLHSQRNITYTFAASTKEAQNFFAVKVKNEYRGKSQVSYTRIVDIKLNGVSIRLLPGNEMLVNGEKKSFPIDDVWGLSVWYSSSWITVSTSWGLIVQFDGIHRVKVKVGSNFFNQLTGMCVNDCNRKKDDVRAIKRCNVSNWNAGCKPYETKRCNVIKHQIFTRCIKKLGKKKVEEYLKSCQIEACFYHKSRKFYKTNLCFTIESFAGVCAQAGFNVDWRKVSKCPKKCPPRQEYKFATPSCQPSCANPKPKCKGFIEGCVCRKGLILSGNKCVPKSKCGCFYKGLYIEANEHIIDTKCERKTTCKAGGKLVSENLAPCEPNGKCTLRNYKRICVCKSGFYFQRGICIPNECKKTMADIVFLLDDSQHMSVSSSKKVIQFVKDVVTNFKIGANYVRVGSVSSSSLLENNFHLNRHFKLNNLLNAIDSIRHRNRNSTLSSAFDYLRTQSFTVANGDRVGIPNVLVMVTDGRPENESQTLKAAKALKDSGVIIFVISVGKSVQHPDLIFLASESSSKSVYTVNNFGVLDEITTKITKLICTVHLCDSRPCKNGGVCERKGKAFICNCKIPFSGRDCTKVTPDCKCSTWGHLHYETFDGQLINFMGSCKYTLATRKATCKLPFFAVEIMNEHRGNTWMTYMRSVDLKIKGVTVRLLTDNKLSVNGELMTLPITDYMGFSATYSVGWIAVTTSFGVEVVFDGHHRIYVKVPGSYRRQLTGLCGDCNGIKDDLKTKTGIDVSKELNVFNLIGKSYEVFDDTFKSYECYKVVDFISKCFPNETNVCNQLKNPSGPFSKCLRRMGSSAQHYYKSCVIDICTNKNLPKIQRSVMCQSYEALSSKCEEFGILVKWRSIMKCPMNCPKDKVYAESTSRCQPNCLNPTPICPHGPTDGCICKSGTILSGTTCVPITSCGCTYKGMYQMAGTDLLLNDCSQTITCMVMNKIEKKPGCSQNCMCSVSGGKRQCVCKRGYQRSRGKCTNPTVLRKFARVFVAFLRETPLLKLHGKFPEICAQRCLKDKTCKSFNFNKLEESCELFSVNAEDRTLESRNYRFDEYYQLIGHKEIFIHGAEILASTNLQSYEGVKTFPDCKNKCQKYGCKRLEYSRKEATCRITKSTKESFELMGNVQWSYYEILS